jgi:hypothetical protein
MFNDRWCQDFLVEMIQSCSVTNSRAIQTSATQPQFLMPLHIFQEQYRHERATLLKQVLSASDHSFKNCMQKCHWLHINRSVRCFLSTSLSEDYDYHCNM